MKNILKILAFTLLTFTFVACSEDDPVSEQHAHAEADGIVLKSGNQILMIIDEGKFDENYADHLSLEVDSTKANLEVFFLDHDGDEFQPDDPDKSLGWLIEDETVLQIMPKTGEKWAFDMLGLKEGTTDLEIRILHNDHPDFKTPKIPVVITK